MINSESINDSIIDAISFSLDQYLREEYLEPCLYHMVQFETVITNLADAVFGYIIGEISRKYYLTYYSLMEREPNSGELSEFNEFLLKNSEKLMSRIKEFVESR